MSDTTTVPNGVTMDETGNTVPPASTTQPTSQNATTTPQTVNTTPWYSDWMKTDGSLNPDSYQRLPEHLKHLEPTLKNAKNVEDVLTKFSNLNTLAGKKGLAPLPADAPANVVKERNELLRSINGVPEKPEGYNIKKPDDLPQELWNDGLFNNALKIMHDGNVPPSVAQKLFEAQLQDAKSQRDASVNYEKQFYATQDKTIRDTIAKQGVAYDKTAEMASRAARTLGIDPDKDPVFKNAKVFLALSKVGQYIGEDKLVSAESVGSNMGESDLSKAKDIVSNKANQYNSMYWDSNHPRNREVKQMVETLQKEGMRKRISALQGGSR